MNYWGSQGGEEAALPKIYNCRIRCYGGDVLHPPLWSATLSDPLVLHGLIWHIYPHSLVSANRTNIIIIITMDGIEWVLSGEIRTRWAVTLPTTTSYHFNPPAPFYLSHSSTHIFCSKLLRPTLSFFIATKAYQVKIVANLRRLTHIYQKFQRFPQKI